MRTLFEIVILPLCWENYASFPLEIALKTDGAPLPLGIDFSAKKNLIHGGAKDV